MKPLLAIIPVFLWLYGCGIQWLPSPDDYPPGMPSNLYRAAVIAQGKPDPMLDYLDPAGMENRRRLYAIEQMQRDIRQMREMQEQEVTRRRMLEGLGLQCRTRQIPYGVAITDCH